MKYEVPEIEIIELDSTDIITTSILKEDGYEYPES